MGCVKHMRNASSSSKGVYVGVWGEVAAVTSQIRQPELSSGVLWQTRRQNSGIKKITR